MPSSDPRRFYLRAAYLHDTFSFGVFILVILLGAPSFPRKHMALRAFQISTLVLFGCSGLIFRMPIHPCHIHVSQIPCIPLLFFISLFCSKLTRYCDTGAVKFFQNFNQLIEIIHWPNNFRHSHSTIERTSGRMKITTRVLLIIKFLFLHGFQFCKMQLSNQHWFLDPQDPNRSCFEGRYSCWHLYFRGQFWIGLDPVQGVDWRDGRQIKVFICCWRLL